MRSIFVLAAAAALLPAAMAQADKDHEAHHPGTASAPAAAASKTPTPAQIDMQMKAMQEMHAKMMAAKTPEERQALMAEHMKTMQNGMAMMSEMHGSSGTPGAAGTAAKPRSMSPEMMGKRLDMMEMMMQMMVDREAAMPPASK